MYTITSRLYMMHWVNAYLGLQEILKVLKALGLFRVFIISVCFYCYLAQYPTLPYFVTITITVTITQAA